MEIDKKILATLNLFGNTIVDKSKKNLKQKVSTGGLIDSIKYKANINNNGFSVYFEMEDYWTFVNYGVQGKGGTKADGSSWERKRVTNSKYKYKKAKPPIMAFNGWTIRKGIAPRNEKGQFTKRRGLLFAIATSVFHTGLETTSFFTKPFEKEFKELPDKLEKAYSFEVEEYLKFTIQ